jgi:AcrR family transcriptional regulator
MPRAALSEPEISAFRKRICEAATKLFAANGYQAVTLRAIAAEVGCSPMTPYRYFSGKDEIFALVKAAVYRRFSEAQEAALASTDDPAAALVALGRAYVDFALAEPDGYRVIFELHQDSASDHPELLEQAERAWCPLLGAVTRAVDAGVLCGDPDTLAHVFWAGIHGLVSLHLADKLRGSRALEDLVEPMMATVFGGNLGSLPVDGIRSDETAGPPAEE